MNFDAHGGTDNRNRAIGLLCVVLLHVLLIWGLMNGLARKAVELLPTPIETKIIEEIHPPMEAAPPPTPEIEPPPLPSIPPPEIVIEQPPPAATQAITQVAPIPQPTPPPRPAPVQAPQTVRVPARFDKGSCPMPRYPEYAKRQGIEGLSRIKLLVAADGRIKDAVVTSSSGSDVLDKAAIAAFKRCQFSVEIVDGVPRDTWFPIQYQWTIKDE
jgi:protein TonB